jgi:hypothetical protein
VPIYIILSRVSPEALEDPKDFRNLAQTVAAKIKRQCPDGKFIMKWRKRAHWFRRLAASVESGVRTQ